MGISPQWEDICTKYTPQNYEGYEGCLNLNMAPVDYPDKSGEKTERTGIKIYLGSLKYTADEREHLIRELPGGKKKKALLRR